MIRFICRYWHFTAPLFMPMVCVLLFRVVFWMAGRAEYDPADIAVWSLIAGFVSGWIILCGRQMSP